MKPEKILKAARERMQEAYDGDKWNREEYEKDARFAAGDQWEEQDRQAREADGKLTLTFNGLSHSVRMVKSQIRDVNPSIKVSAGDNEASEQVSNIFEGLVRQIQNRWDASSVYEHAAQDAATGGIGYFRVRSDYVSPRSFDQEIIIERVYNPLSVFLDPNAKHPCRMDMEYGFIVEEISKDKFERLHPDASSQDFTAEHRADDYHYWQRGNNVVVAEYFWIEYEKITLGLLADGSVVENPPAPMQVVKHRTSQVPKVKWAKLSYGDVLEGPIEIPGRYIPIFAVTGEEIHIGEEVRRSGVIRHAKDAAVAYNYARSAGVEVVALQPKSPYIVTVNQIAGLESIWEQANSSNRPYLPFKPDDKAPGRPQRETPPVSSQGWMQEAQLAAEDIKRTTGIYDAALGAKSNETSGVAIAQRQQESQAGTSIYADNMIKAVEHCGQVVVDWIPAIYDTQRVIRILGADNKEEAVMINQVMTDIMGTQTVNDVTVGRYDVRVSVGPTYETQRAEARDGMMGFLGAVPQAGAATMDLVAEAQDWPNKDQFAERLRKLLPPGMVEEEPTPEQQQQIAAAQEEQAEMQAIGRAMQNINLRKADAEASEAESDASKAQAEAMQQQLETMAQTGQLNAIIAEQVNQALIRVLSSTMQQGPRPPI